MCRGGGGVPIVHSEAFAACGTIDEVHFEEVARGVAGEAGGIIAPLNTKVHYFDGGLDIRSFIHNTVGVLR